MQCCFRLSYPQGECVSLVGDFNDWSATANPLHRRGERWECQIELDAGRYRYAYFVIDSPPSGGEISDAWRTAAIVTSGRPFIEIPDEADAMYEATPEAYLGVLSGERSLN